MSKTDKDRPAWVRVLDPATPVRIVHDHADGHCDAHLHQPQEEGTACYWMVAPWVRRDSILPPPPNSHAREEWWVPDRARERAAMRDLMRSFNADPKGFMETDDADFENRQGRHWVRYHFW